MVAPRHLAWNMHASLGPRGDGHGDGRQGSPARGRASKAAAMAGDVLISFAMIDDQVLDGEDPTTTNLEDAIHWTQVYADLLRLAVKIQAERRSDSLTLQQQVDLYGRRLTFWKTRCREIAERYP